MAKTGLTASQYLYNLLNFFENGGGGGGGGDVIVNLDPIGDETATGDEATDPNGAGTVIQFLKGILDASQEVRDLMGGMLNVNDPSVGDHSESGGAIVDPALSGTLLQFTKGLLTKSIEIATNTKDAKLVVDNIVYLSRAIFGKNGSASWVQQGTEIEPTGPPSVINDGVSAASQPNCFVGIVPSAGDSVSAKIWCLVDGQWGVPRYGELKDLTDPYLEIINTRGVSRIYIQVTDVTESVELKVSPISFVGA